MRPPPHSHPACAPSSAALRRWLPALAALALAGCPANGNSDADAGPGEVVLLPCSTDAECASVGFVCDSIRRTCVCVKDAMCAGSPGGPYCNAFTGRCEKTVAGCKSDAECGTGQFCDPALRTCRQLRGWCDTCTLDAECGGAGALCVTHPDFPSAPRFCGAACGANDTCLSGVCAQTEQGKQCIPAVGRCGPSDTCTPDTGQACSDEGDCTEGANQTCELGAGGTGRCIAKQRTCEGGQACDPVTHKCVNGCTTNQECEERLGAGNECKNMVCVPAALCDEDKDCPSLLQWCFKDSSTDFGRCQSTCTDDKQCPMGQLCIRDVMAGRQRCVEGCRTNADCPLGAICDGTCKTTTADGKQYCQVEDACSFRHTCESNVCAEQPNHCRACGTGCGAGKCTSDLYYSPVCDNTLCSSDPDCHSPDQYCQKSTPTTGRCRPRCTPDPMLNLYDTNVCPIGVDTYACQRSGCVYRCTTDAQCPKGFSCSQVPVGTFPNVDYGPWCWPFDARLCRPP